ncbi:hypothetical protein SAMD00019534_041670 [Acytostelium subglobosum LB1]|uniref:hypothetical protein n=1 Tax=Acytostelium subglobosum LB1 TaxID=1410327 RepID=UPI000644B07B|nr:hypothetical protein SAMD00019534_041670 [Acytostelium subglobosum LB1]GAM20992.1 hypothetical protein SAMD00019534_041670 [Acytostelium subglobosum LB1]|eukprot:XP_012756126.1 hypothetical protein SAMD00019534_041670 [Acytostelium subglobosum LB1]
MVNRNIELPVFPEEYLPYGIDPNDLKDCVLTQDRYDIITKFWNNIKIGEKDVKLAEMTSIMNGPPGSGKSFTLYLLLSIAYVNDCIIVYLRSAKDWIRTKEEDRCQHFIDTFIKFNSGLAAEIPMVNGWIKKQARGNPTNILELFKGITPTYSWIDIVMHELNHVTSVPIILAIDDYEGLIKIDEANDLFKSSDEEMEDYDYLFDFFKVKRVPGKRVSLLVSGCHGDQLSFKWSHMYTNMKPFKANSNRLITDQSSICRDPDALKYSDRLELNVHCITGGNPGELKLLKQWSAKHPHSNPKEYAVERKEYYMDILNDCWDQVKDSHIYYAAEFVRFLHCLFFPDSLEGFIHGPPNMLVDRGLVQRDSRGNYVPACLAARHAMYQFYFFDLHMKDKSDGAKSSSLKRRVGS